MSTLVRRVVVADHGVDAALARRPSDDGQAPLLILRPHQTFGSAVNAVSMLLPHAPQDEVRALVREHLPDAIHLDDLLPLSPAPVPETPAGPYLPASALAGMFSVFFGVVASLGLMQYGVVSQMDQIVTEYKRDLARLDRMTK